ncbi:dammarenediol 12-hydroxylase [Coffea arabica]|uniref:Dammarenediol 12-hydroxylase n=1 Tax=Coffea arabica TaxID=13443 RepID=A0A6P6UQB3_COFAR|nr:dammarenediol 12-hydroxylase-like isoform X1 [Coffea arabica]
MELSQIFLLILSLVLFVYLCICKLSLRDKSLVAISKFAFKNPRLPPGRTGWPLVGETLEYFSKIQQGVLEKFVTERRNKYSSKIFRTSLIGYPMAILCDAEGNKFLFSNENKFVKHWWPSTIDKLFPKSNNKPNTEHTKALHKLLTFILKKDVLRAYVGVMDAIMKQHLQIYAECKLVKIGDMAKTYIFKLACITFLGIDNQGKIDELEKGIEEIATGLHSMPLNFPGTALNRAIKTSKLMREEFESMIRQRKIDLSVHSSSSAKDFVSHMLLATDDGGQFYSEADIACILVGLLQGSYTTVHNTITNIMMYLTEFPDVYNSVLREQKEIADLKEPNNILCWDDLKKMKYSWQVACEVLRLKPPVHGAFKEAITDFNYAGYTIPKGWKIHWIAHATHKNPEYFPDPDKFDPSRFQGDGPAAYTFVPFGGGAHMCPGTEYARLAILIFLHNVVNKYRWEKQIPDEKVLHYPYPRPAHGLPVHLYPHKP